MDGELVCGGPGWQAMLYEKERADANYERDHKLCPCCKSKNLIPMYNGNHVEYFQCVNITKFNQVLPGCGWKGPKSEMIPDEIKVIETEIDEVDVHDYLYAGKRHLILELPVIYIKGKNRVKGFLGFKDGKLFLETPDHNIPLNDLDNIYYEDGRSKWKA